MGVTRVAVTAKLDVETIVSIDELVEQFSPLVEGRSTIVRLLIEVALAAMDSGVIPFTLEGLGPFLQKARGRRNLHDVPRKAVKYGFQALRRPRRGERSERP